MGLQILHGTQPGDLVDFCMRKICQGARMWPQKRAFLIVPEQTKADMERRYLEVMQSLGYQDRAEGLMLVDVLSFNRFSHRILSEIGGLAEEPLDASMNSLIIHRVLSEDKGSFKVLSRFSDRFGFATDLEKILGDFYRYEISPDMLRSADFPDVSKQFTDKMDDFALLMERVDALVETLGYCNKTSPMRRLSDTLDKMSDIALNNDKWEWPYNRLNYLKEASIYIIGFGQTRNFTPEEYHVIDRLIHLCEQVSVALCVDYESEYPVPSDIKGSDAFYFGRSTLKSLTAQNENVRYSPVDVFREKDASLSHLSLCYAKRHAQTHLAETAAVTRVLLPSRVEELSYVAGMIKDLVLKQDYRYKDITVAVCDPEAYASDLHAVFSDYGLDPFLDKRRKLSETPLMRFVFSLLDMSISGGSYLSLMKCSKSGMCHLSQDEVDVFENYCLAHGLYKGYKIFDSKYYVASRDERGPEVWSCVKRAFLPLMDFVSAFSELKKCDQKARLLAEFLDNYLSLEDDSEPNAGHIEYLAAEWVKTNDHDAALALVASYNALNKLLSRLEGPFGDMRISDINFKGLLRSGMDAATSGAIPSYVDQVRITEPSKAFQNACKVLFLVGATRDRFPFQSRSEGYLRDYERELLEQSLGVSFPRHARDSVYSDFFTAYALLDCPEKKLVMTALSSEEPSSVFRFIGSCLPQSVYFDLPVLTLSDPRTYSKRVLSSYFAGVISRQRQTESIAETKRVLYGAKQYPEQIPDIDISTDETRIALPPDMILQRYGDQIKMSVSQIENYAACPFRHFASYLIQLQEREVFSVDSRYKGSLAHEIIERAMKEYINEIERVENDAEKENIHKQFQSKNMRQWAQMLLDEACQDDETGLCADPAVYMSTGGIIIDISEKSIHALLDQIHPNHYLPKEIEWSYGFDDNNAIKLQLDDTDIIISLRGKIDRVDINTESQSYRVIDYKTSQRKIDYRELFAGLSLQLPIYIYAYAQKHPELKPGDAGYFLLSAPVYKVVPDNFSDRFNAISSEKAKSYKVNGMDVGSDELMLSARYATEKIKMHCRRLLTGHYDIRPVYKGKGKKQVCSYCSYTAICGINPKRPPFARMEQIPDMQQTENKKITEKMRYFQAIHQMLEDGENTQCD